MFGVKLALSGDGGTLVVSASGEDSGARGVGGDQADEGIQSAGAAYVFERNGAHWQQQAYLKASNTHNSALFGRSLAISRNGDIVAVGSDWEAGPSAGIGGNQSTANSASIAGAAYVFVRTNGAWAQRNYVKSAKAGISGAFAGALALSADGQVLVGAADSEDDFAGAIYSY
jgi:trimeric autotransporter adhesin